MKSVELLAPARDLESAMAAVDYGADAVYIGGSKFGARRGACNPVEEVARAVEYAHQYGVRIHATLNTLLFDGELADAEAEGLQYQIMQLDDQLMKSRILNPQTGTVLVKYAEPGEVTAAGKPLYKIADTDLLYLRAYVTADQLSHLKLGQSLKVFADYGNDRREYPGTITWISDKSEFTPKGIQTKDERANLVYAIKIAVRNDGYLKIGQYGEIKYE